MMTLTVLRLQGELVGDCPVHLCSQTPGLANIAFFLQCSSFALLSLKWLTCSIPAFLPCPSTVNHSTTALTKGFKTTSNMKRT